MRKSIRQEIPPGIPTPSLLAPPLLALLSLFASLTLFSGCQKTPKAADNPKPAPPDTQLVTSTGSTDSTSSTPSQGKQTAPAINKSAEAVVIGYHRFVSKVKRPDTEITPEDFETQMQALKDDGIEVIGLQDYLAWRRGEKNIPPRCAIITIDDGYKSGYDVAWPILKKFGYPFTMFIYTDYVKGGPKSGGESISWEQLAEMRDAGVDIQSHTVSHKDLRGNRHGPQPPNYEDWLWNELNGSKKMLEEHLAIKVNAIAVPYGFCNQHVRDIAAKAGYESVLTVYGQILDFSSPLDQLGRYIMESNKPKLFATAIAFGGRGGSSGVQPEPIAELTNASIQAQPADGTSIKEKKPMIRADLKSLAPIDPGSLQMRISGLGLVPATYSPATKSVTYHPSKDLTQGDYTVIVSAKSQGKKTEARWSFKVE